MLLVDYVAQVHGMEDIYSKLRTLNFVQTFSPVLFAQLKIINWYPIF